MTYGNECTLKAKACKTPNFRLEVASSGECLPKSIQLNEEENSSWKIKSNIKSAHILYFWGLFTMPYIIYVGMYSGLSVKKLLQFLNGAHYF